tara:strand:+ start:3377 stop:4090 length:714 start_codon:yes stop_codon:yes gene_type:complete
MIKTKFGSIVSHKYNNQYICYDSSIQQILKERILSGFQNDEFRLQNNNNFLDLNNGFIKKHFWRKGGMTILKDNYFFINLGNTRPVKELRNYIDFNYIIKNNVRPEIVDIFELCIPIIAFVNRRGISYQGDIVLSKIEGMTLDNYLEKDNNDFNFYEDLKKCFEVLFSNGIYNMDMNLKNIIYNNKTKKFSFIDFDKLVIDSAKKNDREYSNSVLRKFKKSINKYNLHKKFRWDKFI